MSRLQTEFTRLYHPDPATPGLIDARGRVRALVLELIDPADASALSRVWRGVQNDLGLPAPAIAASGTDGLQLWFSVAEPLAVEAAREWLDAVRRHFLPDLAPRRVRIWPAADPASGDVRHAPPVPAEIGSTGNWSAFLAPDLAPLFAETPWLDTPPGDDGQATLLATLDRIDAGRFAAAWAQVQPPPPPQPSLIPPTPESTPNAAVPAHGPVTSPSAVRAMSADAAGETDPRRFLTSVMADPTAPLALRVEAAKALLHHPPEPETRA